MPPPIDIHAARDMTLPGLVSQDLIRQGDEWLEIPSSRECTQLPRVGQQRLVASDLRSYWPQITVH
jgi:hypothetical protein